MATNVELRTDTLLVKRGGITLTITDTKLGRMGRVQISNAKLIWIPTDQQKGYVLSWKKLGELAVQEGKREA